MNIVDRFFSYVVQDTQSDDQTQLTPSTPGQMAFAKNLEKELKEIGLEDISLDENGYLMASLPANDGKETPVIGFIAHMDTSPDLSGRNVKPRVVKNYDGNDIVLNESQNIVLKTDFFPEIKKYIGQDIVVTDGLTLLGADDKEIGRASCRERVCQYV